MISRGLVASPTSQKTISSVMPARHMTAVGVMNMYITSLESDSVIGARASECSGLASADIRRFYVLPSAQWQWETDWTRVALAGATANFS